MNLDDCPETKIIAAFQQCDSNGDGIITRDELAQVLKKLRSGPEQLVEEDIDELLFAADVNQDGRISYDEFVRWVTNEDVGSEVVDKFDGHRLKALGDINWKASVPAPSHYLERGTVVEDTELRAMTLQQLLDFGDLVRIILDTIDVMDPNANPEYNVGRITCETVNLYHLNDLMVMPLTKPYKCSFMELVAKNGPQPPNWFISHWWGTPFFDSLRMLKFHAKSRDLSPSGCYWMCTFANNQHNLAELAAPRVLDTPFAQAIMMPSCSGTIALMTEKTAMPFTRIWCVLEDYVSLRLAIKKEGGHLFDVASMIPDESQEVRSGEMNTRCAALLTDKGDGSFKDHGGDDEEECWFPAQVSFKAVQLDIRNASASNESDKKNILRLIGEEHDDVSNALSERFAPLALYNWSCTADANADKLKWLLNSGLLGDRDSIHKTIADRDCLVDACEYLDQSTHETITVLLQAGADPNEADKDGTTPLKRALLNHECVILDKLLSAKADMNRECDDTGKTAMEVAAYYATEEVEEILAMHGYSITGEEEDEHEADEHEVDGEADEED